MMATIHDSGRNSVELHSKGNPEVVEQVKLRKAGAAANKPEVSEQ